MASGLSEPSERSPINSHCGSDTKAGRIARTPEFQEVFKVVCCVLPQWELIGPFLGRNRWVVVVQDEELGLVAVAAPFD